ncbi:hypothetical protein [Botrimarina mediterranea]|uniref:hypothetical protein n=1 Tax=Botrimarina mediterranea TaxID=2528022 RepID=UPI00119ED571
MKQKMSFVNVSPLALGIALTGAFVAWSSVGVYAADEKHDAQMSANMARMSHITTQAEAEALKPGDLIAMACSKCKHIMVQQVAKDDSHVKLMTIGQTHECGCGGTVKVVGTSKGNGKDEEVNFTCSKCGDDAMFVCAVKPGSGAMTDMKMGMKMDPKMDMRKGNK